MALKDIEQRAEEYAQQQWGNVHRTGVLGCIDGYKTAATEERERGKRFSVWLADNDWEYSKTRDKYYIPAVEGLFTYEELLNIFIEKEKNTK